MWCDDFDADLLAVVPGAAQALGETAGVRLETFSPLTGGKINGPSAWNTDAGLVAFFWTAPEFRPPASYSTDRPVVPCTFLEAVRDEWVHSCAVAVNRHIVWRPPGQLMQQLMYDLRGWTVLTGREREGIQQAVRRSLTAAASALTAALEGTPKDVAGRKDRPPFAEEITMTDPEETGQVEATEETETAEKAAEEEDGSADE